MGNPKFAINPLKSLLASNHDIVAVISNPPKPMGRKKILQHTEVGKYAINNNLNLIELNDFNNNRKRGLISKNILNRQNFIILIIFSITLYLLL